MTAIRLPAWLNAGSVSYSAENDRLTAAADLAPGGSALAARTGVLPATGGELAVTANGTPNMTVNVSPGQAAIQGTITSTQGVYVCTADSTLNLSIAAANATNPRIDIVVVTVEDAQYAGAANDALLQVITGTPAASPVAPAAPANSVILAQIAVAASATSIITGNITDKRPFTVSRGGVVPCLSSAPPTSPYKGMPAYFTDTSSYAVWDGAQWVDSDRGAARAWTPGTYSDGTHTTAVATTIGDARYFKQGRLVTGWFDITVNAAAGLVAVTIPPFTPSRRHLMCGSIMVTSGVTTTFLGMSADSAAFVFPSTAYGFQAVPNGATVRATFSYESTS